MKESHSQVLDNMEKLNEKLKEVVCAAQVEEIRTVV